MSTTSVSPGAFVEVEGIDPSLRILNRLRSSIERSESGRKKDSIDAGVRGSPLATSFSSRHSGRVCSAVETMSSDLSWV